jgi:hypothetical protein
MRKAVQIYFRRENEISLRHVTFFRHAALAKTPAAVTAKRLDLQGLNHCIVFANEGHLICKKDSASRRHLQSIMAPGKTIRSEVPACIGLFKQSRLCRLCKRRFVRTIDLQKGFSLLEAVNDGSGKEMV